MIYDTNCTLSNEYLEQVAEKGFEGLSDLIRVLINEAMRIERENYLNAKPYERSKERRGQANGFCKACLWRSLKQLILDLGK